MTKILLVYGLILVAKMIEVTLATIRIVLITKGEKLRGAIIGFFEVLLWLLVVSTVLKDISEDPLKMIFYALGFSLGNYFGTVIESRLGFGTVRVEAIIEETECCNLAVQLREAGFAVTVLHGEGKNGYRYVLVLHVKRKRLTELTDLIRRIQANNVVITVNDIKPVYGGYGLLKK